MHKLSKLYVMFNIQFYLLIIHALSLSGTLKLLVYTKTYFINLLQEKEEGKVRNRTQSLPLQARCDKKTKQAIFMRKHEKLHFWDNRIEPLVFKIRSAAYMQKIWIAKPLSINHEPILPSMFYTHTVIYFMKWLYELSTLCFHFTAREWRLTWGSYSESPSSGQWWWGFRSKLAELIL